MYRAIGEFVEAPNNVIRRQLAVTLMELDALVRIKGPGQGVFRNFPAFGQHPYGLQVTVNRQQ